MTSVYKITGDFNDSNFGPLLESLKDKFISMYVEDILYVGVKNLDDIENSKALLKEYLTPVSDYYLEEINEKNLQRQPEVIQNWGSSIFLNMDRARYERNEQEKLRETWEAMNRMEEILQEKLSKINEGGGPDGRN